MGQVDESHLLGWRGHRMERVWVPEPWEPGTPGLLDERDMNDSCLRPLP